MEDFIFTIPDDGVVPREQQLAAANAKQLAMADSKVRLFKDTIVATDEALTAADLNAAECDFSGYAAQNIVAFLDPREDGPENGFLIVAPTVQFNRGVGAVSNNAAGWYHTNDDGSQVFGWGLFTEPAILETQEDSVPVVVQYRIKG